MRPPPTRTNTLITPVIIRAAGDGCRQIEHNDAEGPRISVCAEAEIKEKNRRDACTGAMPAFSIACAAPH
jgi:hypothetical protein